MKLSNVYFLLLLASLLTVSSPCSAQSTAFSEASKDLIFERSHRGYGFLVPKGEGSELGIVTSRSLSCNEALSPDFNSWEQLEKRDVNFLLSVILDNAQPQVELHHQFMSLRDNSTLFYTTKDKFRKKIYSSQREEWLNVSNELQKLSEKFFHLELKSTPAENVKAAVMLDILDTRNGVQFDSMRNSMLNSFFLLSDTYRAQVRVLVSKLFKLAEGEYQDFITKEESFYLLGNPLTQIAKKVERAHKLLSRGKKEDAYESFLSFHISQIEHFKNSMNSEGHPLIENQAFSEGVLTAAACAIKAVPIQCSGFTRSGDISQLSKLFYLEYFHAWREFKVTEKEEEYAIELRLKFFKSNDLSQENFDELLNKWILWADTFYNRNSGFKGKTVSFQFNFVEAEKEAEDVINLRNCWNASRSSADCSLPSQPNAKNFTIDLKKDVLLEEVGHHMGLFDEYKMSYYHFNALGAANSFMVADDNYRLYPSHIQQILAPHLICK